jgi:hypothetical protein
MFNDLFSLSTGLRDSIRAPRGTFERIMSHVKGVENALGIKRAKYLDNPEQWSIPSFENISDETLCETVEFHNEWVRRLHRSFVEWSANPPMDAEEITPEQAERFWPGLETIEVPVTRWTQKYYVARMQHLFSVMTTGEEEDGVIFDAKKLTPRQAEAVIVLFEQYIDSHDTRLAVPKGGDYLTGDYEWCELCCAAIVDGPCRKRKCPLKD